MKSRTFCFNKQLFLNTLGRYSYLGVIMGIIYFLLITVPAGNMLLLVRFNRFVTASTFSFYSYVAMILGSVSGLVLFSYLHQPKQVNFYHAQPVNRSTLLTHRLLLGPIYHTAAVAINLILLYCLSVAFGRASMLPWGNIYLSFLRATLAYISIFAVTALAAQLTGTRFAHAEVTIFLLVFPVLFTLSCEWLMESFQDQYAAGPISHLIMRLTPITHFHDPTVIGLIYCTLLAAAAIWLCFVLYQRRPLERAGQAVISDRTGHIIRILGAVILAIYGGLLNWWIYGSSSYHHEYISVLYVLWGMVLGIIIWNMICQVQIHHTFKAALRGLRSQSIALLSAVLAFLLAISVGKFYNKITYMPEQLYAVEFDLGYESWLGQYHSDIYQSFTDQTKLTLKGDSGKSTALELITVLQAENERLEHGGISHDTGDWKINPAQYTDSIYYTNLTYTFYPKFGIPTTHEFSEALSAQDMEAMNAVYSLPEFRQQHIILDFDSTTVSDYNWVLEKDSVVGEIVIPESRVQELVEALQQDIMDCQMDPREYSFGSLLIQNKQYMGQVERYSNTTYATIPLYRSFTRTMELLKDMHLVARE